MWFVGHRYILSASKVKFNLSNCHLVVDNRSDSGWRVTVFSICGRLTPIVVVVPVLVVTVVYCNTISTASCLSISNACSLYLINIVEAVIHKPSDQWRLANYKKTGTSFQSYDQCMHTHKMLFHRSWNIRRCILQCSPTFQQTSSVFWHQQWAAQCITVRPTAGKVCLLPGPQPACLSRGGRRSRKGGNFMHIMDFSSLPTPYP